METSGKAYGYFYSAVSKDKIEKELPRLREAVKAPSELELRLSGVSGQTPADPQLALIHRLAQEQGINYVVEAVLPRRSNKKAANETAAILNQAYNSPLYSDGEEFKGRIVYKRGNQLASRE